MALILESIKKDRDVDIVETLVKLQEVKSQIRALKDLEKTLTTIIQRVMGEQEAIVDGDGDTLCTWTWSERRTIDTKRLEEDHPDLIQKYVEMKSIRTFRC